MNHSYLRTIAIALTTFLLGNGIDYLTNTETILGLDTLFKIRGARPPPTNVVVVAMDEASETRFDLRQDFTRWRGLHAKLLQALQRQKPALIVFDLQFMAPDPKHDPAFVAAIQQAGNVLVTDCTQKLRSGNKDFYGRTACSKNNTQPFVQVDNSSEPLPIQLVSLKKNEPTPAIRESVVDHAPFLLPDDAVNPVVRESWLFLDELAEAPTLPLVTWLYYLQRTGALQSIIQPETPYSNWLTNQRRLCKSSKIDNAAAIPGHSNLRSYLNYLLCQEDSRFIDFYGPPQTFRMESYADVYDGKVNDLQGKVIFVGMSNRQFAPTTPDFFLTPFTNTQSGKMAGVEIMATQFANLLEGRFVISPVPPMLCSIAFALSIGILLVQLAGFWSITLNVLLATAYFGLVIHYFTRYGLWLPIAVPLLIQLPIAWLLALFWARRDLINERQRILDFVRQVFPQWVHLLPSMPGQWYPERSAKQSAYERTVNGLCLATDIAGYTSLASQHSPQEMWALLKSYYQVLGHPVRSRKGVIANIQGDAMMALWIDLEPNAQRYAACIAALEIEAAVSQFNETSAIGQLPTRIGLHEGELVLGCGEAAGFRFYNPFGDTVNTASRIEGVNKYLGTKILATASFANSLGNIVARPVGSFCLKGREEPIALLEIVGIEAEISPSQQQLIQKFALGLAAFQQGEWDAAIQQFDRLLAKYGEDGPSQFYKQQALIYKEIPPSHWEGIVVLAEK